MLKQRNVFSQIKSDTIIKDLMKIKKVSAMMGIPVVNIMDFSKTEIDINAI